jgi:Holliday junction resolvase RusA-like endonuclease
LREEILWVPITGRKKLSLNRIYAGAHWSVRSKQKNAIRQMVNMACRGVKPFSKPVSLTFRATLGKGSVTWDISNHGYLVKLVEDALVKKGVLVDDSQKWVRQIITQPSIRDVETGDGLWVRIQECEEDWWEP